MKPCLGVVASLRGRAEGEGLCIRGTVCHEQQRGPGDGCNTVPRHVLQRAAAVSEQGQLQKAQPGHLTQRDLDDTGRGAFTTASLSHSRQAARVARSSVCSSRACTSSSRLALRTLGSSLHRPVTAQRTHSSSSGGVGVRFITFYAQCTKTPLLGIV